MRTIRRPAESEYDAFYAGYIAAVPDGEIVEVLRDTGEVELLDIAAVPHALHDHAYAPGKWTVRQVVQHVVDAEWVFSYRALRFARGDQTELPGMDQDVFMAGLRGTRSVESMLDEFRHLRAANCALFESFDDEVLDRTGVASGYPVSVRALLYIIAGHAIHHWRVLRERYLAG